MASAEAIEVAIDVAEYGLEAYLLARREVMRQIYEATRRPDAADLSMFERSGFERALNVSAAKDHGS